MTFDELKEKTTTKLEDVRPSLQADGGDIELKEDLTPDYNLAGKMCC